MFEKQSHSSRRLLVLFAATTVVPAVSLAWLGWRMVEQDRLLESKRVQEKRDQAADLAATAMQRILAEAEERLTTFSAAPSSPAAALGDGAALVVLGNGGVLSRAGTPLPYYPAIPPSAPTDSAGLAAADELEFRKNDLAGALRALEGSAHSRDPVLRGEAWLRMARIQRKLGNLPKALDAFAELGRLDNARVSGLPAGLRALQGCALIFEASGREEDLKREAALLRDGLENARWLLTRVEFEFSFDQAAKWLGNASHGPIDPDRLALAEAAESLWQEWQTLRKREVNPRGRRTFRSGKRSVLLLTRSSSERVAALLIGPRFLDSAWLKELHAAGRAQEVDFALTDAEGRPVLGRPDAPLSLQSLRPASATQLPWTVHAISRAAGLGSPELSGRTRLLLAGIAMMALLVLAGGYFINRAVLREVTVARLQSDFVAAVSHEFRTPLTTVRQLSEMLVRGRVTTEERRQQFYETLLRESERLHRLVEGLLNFGRMEAGELQYRFEPVDAEAFVRDVVAEFQQEVSGLGYRIELHGNGALPAIRADRESLALVFWNLLDNAVKYSPENRTVWVDLSDAGKRLMVRVRDRGIGIPLVEQKEIFRKFVRGAASKTASIRGTGVGLAMARQIVTAHGGDISVESQPGEGSVFTVLLPVAET
jgi:signal transduction histidine kinase